MTTKKSHYVVVHAFGDYSRGDKITAAAEMQAVRDAGQLPNVVVAKEAEPDPEPEPNP